MNLLIVNDEKMTADTMRDKIEWNRYGIQKVFVAYDAESARICLKNERIDILLCDIEMPGENGIELMRWVREQKMELECIFISCHAKFDYAQAAFSLGCRDYILIPARYEEICEKVKNVVDRIAQSREDKYFLEYGRAIIKEQSRSKNMEEKQTLKISRGEIIEQAVTFIMSRLTDSNLSVEMVSEQFHFHPVYMNRIFKEEKDITMSRFITNERMKLAISIMEQGECNAFEIAQKVGYQQYTNFFNMFKKNYGVSPAKYRELYLSKEKGKVENKYV